MGMVSSIDNPYPKQIKVDPSATLKLEVPKESVSNTYAGGLTVVRKKPVGKPQYRSRVVDEFPPVIKLVKYPSQPNFYPHNNYVTPTPRKMFLHDDRIGNRGGRTIMYNEPGLAGQRKMILYDPHSSQPPKKLVLYKPSQYSNPNQRVMNYYDQSIRDMNATTRNVGANPQNLPYLNPTTKFSNDSYYSNYPTYPQGFVDRRFYNGIIDDQMKDSGKLVSLPYKGTTISDGGSGGTSLITLSSTPVRRHSDSAILTTRELEVETIDRFQDSTGKIYKIVKPVGERTRVVYSKPENYDRLLIVETPGRGNYIISKAGEPISDVVKSVPMDQNAHDGSESQNALDESEIVPEVDQTIILKEHPIVPEETQIVPEEPQIVPEEPQIVPEESQIVPEEPQIVPDKSEMAPEEPQFVPDIVSDEGAEGETRAVVPHGTKFNKIGTLTTSSTQTNPKINYKKDPKTIRMMRRRGSSVTEIATN